MTLLRQGTPMQSAVPVPGAQAIVDKPVRVMIVDDSAVVRGLVSRWIDEEPGLETVSRHANGKLAIEDVAKSAPDVILLDIEMPVLDGLTALPLLLQARPQAKILMVSTLTKRNAEISFKALTLGAVDYVPKPDSNREISLSTDFRSEVIRKVKAIGRAGRWVSELPGKLGFKRRPYSMVPPRIIAIGSSTGGPEALSAMLEPLAPALDRVGIVIAQHMPPMFTAILAERLGRVTGRPAREGTDGEPLKPGIIYVAPGNHHMTVVNADNPRLQLSDTPPVHFCRPAADPLFKSVAQAFGPAALGIVLTGMGQDGAAGATAIADAGGSVIAQDEKSSVVWGMPGAAVAAGACAAMLPPPEIGFAAAGLLRGERQ